MRVLAYCVMPNHFHLVCWPAIDGQLPRFMRWVTGTHAARWRSWTGTRGYGAVYQGRYRCSPVKSDGHLIAVCRYVERNPLRASLVEWAEDWPWSSLQQRLKGVDAVQLTDWPAPRPFNWLAMVNAGDSASLQALRG